MVPQSPADEPGRLMADRRRIGIVFVSLVALAAAFFLPLRDLLLFSSSDDLYSYVPLIPIVSAYLIWSSRHRIACGGTPDWRYVVPALALGLAALGFLATARVGGRTLSEEDYLSVAIAALVFLAAAVVFLVMGRRSTPALRFPLCFLIFAIPFPEFLHAWIEQTLQHRSADVAHGFFLLSGMVLMREGNVFHLPGFSLEVAPECSGIHSTLVLIITSVLAGHLFLRSKLNRVLLVVGAVAVALLRNGFRILVIGELCVHIGPQMINSYIHRHGGPIFFALSLIPFLLLLRWLRRREVAR